jgi:tellurite resistance protein
MTFGFMGYMQQPPEASVLDGMIETMVLMAMVDGVLVESEIHNLANLSFKFMQENPKFGQLSSQQLQERCQHFSRLIVQQGVPARAQAIANALPATEQRALAVFFALVIAASDGHLDSAERQFLAQLQQTFQFSDQQIQEIMNAFNESVRRSHGH